MIGLDPSTFVFIAVRQNTKKNANTEFVILAEAADKKRTFKQNTYTVLYGLFDTNDSFGSGDAHVHCNKTKYQEERKCRGRAGKRVR